MTNLNTRVRAKGALFTNYYLACALPTFRDEAGGGDACMLSTHCLRRRRRRRRRR
jgi:hypothetical protein